MTHLTKSGCPQNPSPAIVGPPFSEGWFILGRPGSSRPGVKPGGALTCSRPQPCLPLVPLCPADTRKLVCQPLSLPGAGRHPQGGATSPQPPSSPSPHHAEPAPRKPEQATPKHRRVDHPPELPDDGGGWGRGLRLLTRHPWGVGEDSGYPGPLLRILYS